MRDNNEHTDYYEHEQRELRVTGRVQVQGLQLLRDKNRKTQDDDTAREEITTADQHKLNTGPISSQ